MSEWADWQILVVMALLAAKYFVIGSIWGHMRATHRMNRALRFPPHHQRRDS